MPAMRRVDRLPHLLRGLGLAAVLALAACHARAQEAPDAPPHSEVSLTPYLFIPGVSGNVGAAADIPPVPVDADFPAVFNKLDGFFMLQGEARYGDFGVTGDYLSLKISGDHNVTFNHLPAASGTIEVTAKGATLAGFWRFYQSDRYTADVVGGARYSSVKSAASITVGARTASGEASLDGWDPVIGVRGTWRTGRRGSLSGYADFGGGSFADSVWQVMAAYNWRFTDHIVGIVGWRGYGESISRGDNKYDVTLSGPVIGARFRFY